MLGLPWALDWKQEGKDLGIQAAPKGPKKGINPPLGAAGRGRFDPAERVGASGGTPGGQS